MYQQLIIKTLKCSNEAAIKVEDIMRNDIFHSTLDWQTKEQFVKGVKEAYELYLLLN